MVLSDTNSVKKHDNTHVSRNQELTASNVFPHNLNSELSEKVQAIRRKVIE